MAQPTQGECGCHPRVDILAGKAIRGDTLYLIRLREDWDSLTSFLLRRLSEIQELDLHLREAQMCAKMPILPVTRRFSVRRQLSKLGMSRHLDKQQECVQQYMESMLAQFPSIVADRHLQNFFAPTVSLLDKELLTTMLLASRSGINLGTLKGSWKPKGFDYIWTIEQTGKALLDGRYCGVEFDITEQGEGLQYTLSRLDGWKVDIEKSTPQRLFWYLPGEADLEWIREVAEN